MIQLLLVLLLLWSLPPIEIETSLLRVKEGENFRGVVIYPFILHSMNPPPEALVHEHYHFERMQRIGVVGWYVAYIWESESMEQRAYAAEGR